MSVDLLLKDLKAYVDGRIIECCIAIDNGRIFKIGKEPIMPRAASYTSLRGLLVLPGMIDVHVHLRDEGKAYKEDFYSGTAAAATGGITTVLDMPNNNPVTMSVETLKNRISVAAGKILTNVGFYSEFPKTLDEIEAVIREGCVAFKLFLGDQVGGLDINDDEAVAEAFRRIGGKVPVSVHAEDNETLEKSIKKLKEMNRNDIEAFLIAHSEEAEIKAVQRVIKISKLTGVHVHFCHISSSEALELIAEAKRAGLPVTCEATPHHMFLSVEALLQMGSIALTLPPLRGKSHMDAVWLGVLSGLVDVVASDHAPHTVEEKRAGSVWNVKAGIPGLETTLPLLLTQVNKGFMAIADVVRLMAENPARIFRLKDRGHVRKGYKADLVAVDLSKECRIDASGFNSKAKYSPFDGWEIKGKPMKTFVNGYLVMDEGEIVGNPGCGEIIRGTTL